ncbi:MAG: DUF4382 domain-containing protein [Oligoflexus sp.]|nr:DUF4382 domain-containing protein [Oligoflexus sp.]
MFKISHIHLGFLFSVFLVDGCGGTLGGNPEAEGGPAASGKALSFAITDAPVEGAKSVFITVESVSLLKADGEWLSIPLETSTEIDLLHYQDGLTSPLAAIADISAGTYSQTRLVLSDSSPARLIDLDGVEHSLKIPSGSESGLKINSPIVFEAGVTKSLVIDFDLRKSIKLTGNGNSPNAKYMMKPILRMIESKDAGNLQGTASNGDIVCLYPSGNAMDSTDDCDNAIVSGTAKDSRIKIGFIPPGTYDLRVFRNKVVLKDVKGVKIESVSLTTVDGL